MKQATTIPARRLFQLDFALLREHTFFMLDLQGASRIITRHIPDVQAVYLYGSAADSAVPLDAAGDIDIALLLPPGSPLDRAQLMLSELRAELEDELGHPVDLADLRGAATTFAIEVIHTGQRVLTCNHYAADTFEMLTLSAYQKLNYQRAGILADILATGRVVQL